MNRTFEENENFPSSGEIEVEQRKWRDNFVSIEVEITDMENPSTVNWLERIKDIWSRIFKICGVLAEKN